MPNPKVGTVTKDVIGAITSFKSGAIKFRSDSGSNVHIIVGKADFDNDSIEENVKKAVEEIKKAKPKEAPPNFIRGAVMSSTMGVGIKVDVSSFLQ